MAYRSFVSLNIALIGYSDVSYNMAMSFISAGHVVYAADRDGAVINPAMRLLDNVQVCSIEAAAEYADFIVIATPAADVREVAYWLGDVRKKVIIDLTANVPAEAGNTEVINTTNAITAITGAQHIVKALSIRGYNIHFNQLFGGQQVDMVLAGDSRKAKEIAKIIARECGFATFTDLGSSDAFTLVDDLARYWQRINSSAMPKPVLVTKHATRK